MLEIECKFGSDDFFVIEFKSYDNKRIQYLSIYESHNNKLRIRYAPHKDIIIGYLIKNNINPLTIFKEGVIV